jgi:phosphoribosylanthranilate isomerase
MTRVKMCGMRTPADIAAVNLVRPDYVGFVFVPGRRRAVSPERARVLRGLLAPGICAVGVFVDAPVDTVAALLADGTIDVAQLHGSEDAAYIERLRRAAGLALADVAGARIIDARTVRTAADVRSAAKARPTPSCSTTGWVPARPSTTPSSSLPAAPSSWPAASTPKTWARSLGASRRSRST